MIVKHIFNLTLRFTKTVVGCRDSGGCVFKVFESYCTCLTSKLRKKISNILFNFTFSRLKIRITVSTWLSNIHFILHPDSRKQLSVVATASNAFSGAARYPNKSKIKSIELYCGCLEINVTAQDDIYNNYLCIGLP